MVARASGEKGANTHDDIVVDLTCSVLAAVVEQSGCSTAVILSPPPAPALAGKRLGLYRVSTGVYSVAFSPAYATGTRPAVTASAELNGPAKFAMVNTPLDSPVRILVVNGSGTALDCDFYFIAIGPR